MGYSPPDILAEKKNLKDVFPLFWNLIFFGIVTSFSYSSLVWTEINDDPIASDPEA
jgi:hypothetical protein